MRILIDMQGVQTHSRFRGLGRYAMCLAQAMVINRGNHEIVLVLNGFYPDTIEPIRAAFDGLLPQENIRIWHAPGPLGFHDPANEFRCDVAERVREAFFLSLKPDVVLIISLFEGFGENAITSIGSFTSQLTTAVVSHDLIPLIHRDIYFKNPLYERWYLKKTDHLRCADIILSISESSEREVVEHLNFPKDKVFNISSACYAMFRRLEIAEADKNKFLSRINIAQPFILYAGGGDAHKNLQRLILAYAKLPKALKDTHQLVFAGHISKDFVVPQLLKVARSAGIHESRLVFTSHITDEDLHWLYNLCTVFVMPSLHEGFGLPVLEAMSCGAPVIGANRTSIPDLIGRQDALFDPYDEASISHKIAQVLNDGEFRNDLADHGLEQAKKFSWEITARRTIQAFETLLSPKVEGTKNNEQRNLLPRLVQDIARTIGGNVSDHELLGLAQALARIHTEDAPRQLFVDISELVQRDAGTGVQRVTKNILKELLEHPPEGWVVRPVYATINSQGYLYARKFTAHFQGLYSDGNDELIDYRAGDLFLGLDLQHHTTKAQASYLTSMHQEGVSVYFLIHDLLPIQFPNYWPQESMIDKLHAEWLHIISRFDGVVCVSRTVSEEFSQWFEINGPKRLRPLRIQWSHNGTDYATSFISGGLPDDSDHVFQQLQNCPTFLVVATIEPRKGHVQVLDAFELLWAKGVDVNLIFVGKEGWMMEKAVKRFLVHPQLNKHFFWLQGISDEYLERIYAASTCLIAAGEGEGFGLPLIEAAQRKLPIIARDIPVFREVAGEHAFFFSGLAPQNLYNAIDKWLLLNAQGKAPQSTGLPWLTWRQSTQNLLRAILPEVKTN